MCINTFARSTIGHDGRVPYLLEGLPTSIARPIEIDPTESVVGTWTDAVRYPVAMATPRRVRSFIR
ncbi:hypothetical protein EA472_15240 [Natrarchaeobius oligotrophus]|uniref:Uncharacterized protein n=1 Tax=Natrarchaeobius chitinivorans TaxID=1679083 RepID=A0A3N6M9U7_NATCH|nr:hypothetical protein EA472_15240 [Natrarchaeobius chitinivorans]